MNGFQLFFLFIRLPLDYIALIAAALTAYWIRLSEPVRAVRHVNIGLPFDAYFQVALIVGIVWIIIFVFSGLYSIDPNQKFTSEVYRIFIACSAGFAATAVLIFLRGELFNSRFIVLVASALAVVYVFLSRFFVRLIQQWMHQLGYGNQHIVVIGDDDTADLVVDYLKHHKYAGRELARRYKSFTKKVADSIKKMHAQDRIDGFIFTNVERKNEALQLLAFCETHHMSFFYAADLFDSYAPARDMLVFGSVPLVGLRRTRLHGWGRIIKRFADIISSSLLIILLSPLLVVVALLVMFETGAPIIFRNRRVGEKGRLFEVLKFRTMYQKDSIGVQFSGSQKALKKEQKLIQQKSKKQGPVYKIMDDPRVTPLGKILRRWSLDELPQLFNVLGGSMSMVGPRPHQPREVAQYADHHKKVLEIKPGITGLAQISGRSDLSFEEEVQLDTVYIEQWSLLSDIMILLKTPVAVLRKDGAY